MIRWISTCFVGACLCLQTSCANGDSKPKDGDAAKTSAATGASFAPANVDPKADEVLRRMGKTLASAKSFTFEAQDMIDQVMDDGQKIQLSKTLNVRVRRPGAVSADVRGDAEDLHFVYNGNKVLICNRVENVYAIQDVPKENNIDAMFDFLAMKYGLTAPLSDLAFADPYATLIERVRQGRYLGLHQVGDVKAHHLAFRQEGVDWQIWVEDSERAVPRKIVITYQEQPGHPQFVALLDKWDLSANVPDSAFDLKPPEGAKRKDLVAVDSADRKP